MGRAPPFATSYVSVTTATVAHFADMNRSDMAHSSVPRGDDAEPFPSGEIRPNNEPDDDAIILAPD